MNAANKVSLTFEQKGQRLLLLALMLMILINPFVSHRPAMSWLGSFTLMVVLLAAAYTVSGRGRGFRITLLLGVPALLSQLVEFTTDSFWLETLRYSATPLFLFWVCILLLKGIAQRIGNVTMELLMSAVHDVPWNPLPAAEGVGLKRQGKPGVQRKCWKRPMVGQTRDPNQRT